MNVLFLIFQITSGNKSFSSPYCKLRHQSINKVADSAFHVIFFIMANGNESFSDVQAEINKSLKYTNLTELG